uniref:ribonuclease H n=1 Tax=Astyanax mexicanus TaxID=7994 RepID=A0A3B1JC70_ASTMX
MSHPPKQTAAESSKLYTVHRTYRWAPDSADKFIHALQSVNVSNKITNFINTDFENNKQSVNHAVSEINSIFHIASSMAELQKIKRKPGKKMKKEKWYDYECQSIRKELRKLSNLKHRQPEDQDLRKKYFDTLKQYKHSIRTKKLNYTNKTLRDIEDSIEHNQFWEMWNNLSKTKSQEIPTQNSEMWKNHFENLYKEISEKDLNSNYNLITQKLQSFECAIKDNQNPLDYPITQVELAQKLKSLKSKKACGPDSIRNEMLKNSTPDLQEAMLKLFNLVLSSGCFPDIWSQGLITPIHKSGDKSDPNNFRGICVSSNLGKVFNNILNNRILSFLTEHDVLSKNQIGFLPNHRTTDQIYTLHTLINQHVHQTKNGKIFACFVDFKKAFDSIWHKGLYYKLLESGVGGKVYDIIKSMYLENKCGVRIGDKHTEFFTQKRGVRQGCSLSPTLFNIYINELAVQLEQSAAPGLTLQGGEVKFLLYADDLVLLSPTAQGLQQHLDLLEQYCQNWALAVNLKKTKVMIFQKKPRCQEHRYQFSLGSTALEHTMQYTYLGLIINASGSFSSAVNALKDKAHRAMYAIRRKFFNIDIPIPIWCKVFDSVIQPIALYGSEVWGPLSQHSYTRWDKHPTEVLHAEFCRMILKVQRKTPTNACRAELGRFPLIINIQKRALNFWMHLKTSPSDTLQFRALQTQELNPEKSSLSQLVLRLINSLTDTNRQQPQPSTALPPKLNIRQITKHSQSDYLEHWQKEIQTQNKLECYRALKTEYKLEEYLLTVRDRKQRQILTKYRLSDHRLAVETGRYKQSWLPREERLCAHCSTGEVETEMHFLLQCEKFKETRNFFINKFNYLIQNFETFSLLEKLRITLGEGHTAPLAAKYVSACHSLRDSG